MRAEAWEGFDFMTLDSGINPLAASYSGVPYQARGVDPIASAETALSFWKSATVEPQPMPALPGVGSLPDSGTLKKVGYGAVGSLLAIVLIALGILIIMKG